MELNRRTLAKLLAGTPLAGLAGGAISVVAQDDSGRPVVRFGVDAGDVQSLDPHYAVGGQDRPVVDMIYNGLLRYQPGNLGVIEPDLAEEIPTPEIVDGVQTWTFKLRQGVMFHASETTEAYELTAEDVVYSLEKAASADTSGFSADYEGMAATMVDDYTVAITQDPPLSDVLFLPKLVNYAGGLIVSKVAIETMGLDVYRTNPVGTGPFKFSEYNATTNVVLTANDDYFRGAPQLGGVEVRYMADPAARELGLGSGDLESANGLAESPWVERVSAQENLEVDIFGIGEVAFVCLDTTVAPLDNPLVREAIILAIDREEHLALYGDDVAEQVYSIVPAQYMPGGLTREEAEEAGLPIDRDVDRAIELLAEAGYPDGFELKLMSSEMGIYRGNYEVLQAELSDIGISMDLSIVDHATMQSEIRQGANPIVIYIAYRPNADAYLTQFFHSDSVIVTGASPVANFSRYEGIDELIDNAKVETDPAAQEELWKQAHIQIQQDFAVFPLNIRKFVWGRQSKLDYGHEVVATAALYPQINETTVLSEDD